VRAAFSLPLEWNAAWVSPRADDAYAEYRDGAFLDRLNLSRLRDELARFWPTGGPQWDALATTSDRGVVLLEAKAHTGELRSSLQATNPDSVAKIAESLASTRKALGVADSAEWNAPFYQYVNRLAHLHFLRSQGIQAYLVFVYFVGDAERVGPTSKQGWEDELSAVYQSLHLTATPAHVCNVFIDVALTPELVVV